MMMAQQLALIVCSFALPTLVHRTIFGPRHPIDDMSAAMVKGPPAIHSIENTTGAPQSAFPQSRASPSVRRSVHSLHAAQPKSGPKFRIALPSKRRPWDQAPLSTTGPTSIGEGRVQPHGVRREEGTRPRGLAPNEMAGVLRVFLWRTIGAARRQQLSLWGGSPRSQSSSRRLPFALHLASPQSSCPSWAQSPCGSGLTPRSTGCS